MEILTEYNNAGLLYQICELCQPSLIHCWCNLTKLPGEFVESKLKRSSAWGLIPGYHLEQTWNSKQYLKNQSELICLRFTCTKLERCTLATYYVSEYLKERGCAALGCWILPHIIQLRCLHFILPSAAEVSCWNDPKACMVDNVTIIAMLFLEKDKLANAELCALQLGCSLGWYIQPCAVLQLPVWMFLLFHRGMSKSTSIFKHPKRQELTFSEKPLIAVIATVLIVWKTH